MNRVSQSRGPALGTEAPSINQDVRLASADSQRLPRFSLRGTGSEASLDVRADEHHQNPSSARTSVGWALSWTDQSHSRAYLGRLDEAGRAQGAPILVREATTDEEDVWSASVASAGQEIGVAWADPANGRVRLARFDASTGQALGPATIVHQGLEMPTSTRVVWNGTEFAVAVGLQEGVFFARVDREGARVGNGLVMAESSPNATVDALAPSPAGWALSWHDAGDGSTVHQLRLGHDGRPLETTGMRVHRLSFRRLASL